MMPPVETGGISSKLKHFKQIIYYAGNISAANFSLNCSISSNDGIFTHYF